ncbi:MAG: transposase [Rubrivivax sp.]|nr:transposase [Rubrivivax sp.]
MATTHYDLAKLPAELEDKTEALGQELPLAVFQEPGHGDQATLRRRCIRMLNHRSNTSVESMNWQLQNAKRAARGYRTARNFIAVAYLRLSRLRYLPAHPFSVDAPVR